MIRILLCLALLCLAAPRVAATILVRIPGVAGDSQFEGYRDWIVADSLSWSVERELIDGGKPGTEDLNLGVGELECVGISKSLDQSSANLFQLAIVGSSVETIEIRIVERIQDQGVPKIITIAIFKLGIGFVKTISTSGDADDRPTEDVQFYYNRIAYRYYARDSEGRFTTAHTMDWDRVRSRRWADHGLPVTPPVDGR